MTQLNLAEELGLSRSTVAGYETGHSVPDIYTLQQIAKVLDTSIGYLMGEDEEPDLIVRITNEDPQILRIMEIAKSLNAEGLEKVVEYADLLKVSGLYPKKQLWTLKNDG